MKWSKVLSSLERHLQAIKRGEDFDKETGLLHSAHVMCNAAFLTEYYKIYPQGDDRPHKYLNEPKIGLDIDEVLCDFVGGCIEKFPEMTDRSVYWNDPHIAMNWKSIMDDEAFWLNLKPRVTHDLLKFSPLKDDFARKIGATAVKTLDSIKDLHLHDFAIYLDLELDDEQRAKLENDMTIAIEKGMMSVADKYKVLSIKNFKLALAYMTILMNKHQKKAQEQKLEEFKAQSDQNIRAAQEAEGARQQTAKMINQFDIAKQQLVNDGLIQKEQVKGENDRATMSMKIEGDMQIAQIQGSVQMQKQNEAEDRKDLRTAKQAEQQSQLLVERSKEKPSPIDFQSNEEVNQMFQLD